jgi:histidinol-phosphate aminotransferase
MYPDDSMLELRNALAEKFGVEIKNLIIGAGSDQVISFAVNAKANRHKRLLTAKTTFAMYEIYARQIGTKVLKTPSHKHNLDEFYNLYKKNRDEIGIIFLCLPNNPLGESLDKEAVFDFIRKIDDNTMVVVDGAYQDFAAAKDPKKKIDPKELIETFPNALYLGTFSKSYGLGGMRVGYGIGGEEIIQALYKMRPPFNVTSLSLKAAVAALEDQEFVDKTIENNFKEMEKYEDFARKNKIDYIESYTNFITLLFDEKRNSSEIAQMLLKKGIIIRDLKSYGINGIRVTIGLPEQNERFFKEISPLL